MTLCFATNNRHKLSEIQKLLGGEFDLVTLADVGCHEALAEDQDTMEGNSLQKASYVFNHFHIPTFADDSGLCVDVLNGAPGVYSAHYAGPDRNDNENIVLLLKNLQNEKVRRAHFRTVITLVDAADIHQFEGRVEGRILESRRGTRGFGYDPIFLPDGFDKTFGEMTELEKNEISHRAKAFRKLVDFLETRRVTSGHE